MFCDPQSVNKQAQNVLRTDEEGIKILQSAALFEKYVAQSPGIQYFIEHDPTYDPKAAEAERRMREGKSKALKGGKDARLQSAIAEQNSHQADGNAGGPYPGGPWVIRKQLAIDHPVYDAQGNDVGRRREVQVQAYYFVAGFTIYQAPTIASVLSSKMMHIYKVLGESMEAAMTMPQFTPALGHYYEAEASSTRQSASHRTATAQASKEGTPMPDNASTITAAPANQAGIMFASNLLAESFNLSLKYRDEYMDENPLSGTPGNFKINKLRADGTLMEQKAGLKATTPLPPPIDTNVQNPLMKGAKGGEKSPTTPGGTKKKKKSKQTTAAPTPR